MNFITKKKIRKAYFQAGKIVHWLEHLPHKFEALSPVTQNRHRAQYSSTRQIVLWSLNAHCHALSNCGLIKLFLSCLTQVYSLQTGMLCYIKVQIPPHSILISQWVLLGFLTCRRVGEGFLIGEEMMQRQLHYQSSPQHEWQLTKAGKTST